jgi:predicted nuclease with TOPRIM domain
MATKALTTDQCQVLHKHWPDDCCLCKSKERIAELERERDEAREKLAKSEEEYCKLYDKCHELKALCREARLRLLKLDDVFDKGDLRERLREAGGE